MISRKEYITRILMGIALIITLIIMFIVTWPAMQEDAKKSWVERWHQELSR